MGFGVNKEPRPSQGHENSRRVRGDDSKENRKNEIYRVNVLVPDSCHSWLICLANFMLLVFLSSYSRVNYMTFLDLVQKFDVSITTASIGFTLQLLSLSLMSTLVTSLIVPVTGERIACVVASCVGSLATLGVGLSSNIAVYLVMMTIKGACFGVTTVPPLALISKYFVKWKSLATAIACSGMAVGSMGAPPVAEVMLQNYGLHWTYILIAGLELNTIWASMLLRPTGRYKKILRHDDEKEKGSNLTQDERNNLCELQPLADSKDALASQQPNGNPYEKPNNEIFDTDFDDDDDDDDDRIPKFKSRDQSTATRIDETEKLKDIEISQQAIPFIPDATGEICMSFNALHLDHSPVDSDPDSKISKNNKELDTDSVDGNVQTVVWCEDSRQFSEETEINGKKLAANEMNGADVIQCESSRKSRVTVKTVACAFLQGLYRAFNLQLLRLWSMRCLLLYCTSGVVIMYVPTYLPIMAAKAGMTTDQISLLLIASGGVDFTGRLALGAFSDLKILTASQIVAITQFLMGAVCHFSRFYTNFGTLMLLAVSTGLFAGGRVGLASIICYEYMGPTNLLRSFGVQTTLSTLSLGLHHPLLSSILEATGSFAPPLHYVGTTAFLSAVFLLLQPLARRLDSQRPQMKEIT